MPRFWLDENEHWRGHVAYDGQVDMLCAEYAERSLDEWTGGASPGPRRA